MECERSLIDRWGEEREEREGEGMREGAYACVCGRRFNTEVDAENSLPLS